jgi:methylenetetrahydrofolate reductase (NADPH)
MLPNLTPTAGATPGNGQRPVPAGTPKRPAYPSRMAPQKFEIVCEIEPATKPDLMRVRHQIGVLGQVASAFLIPDNHIGRATVSSIAVAREVQLMGGRSIACINARDRNVLGFQRDLLTAAAYGVNEFLFVYGDRPETGARSDDLTVKTMIRESREFAERAGLAGFKIGVAAGLGPLPQWKRSADFLLAQVTYSIDDLLRWRSSIEVDVPIYAGVMVLPSPAMARKLSADVPQLAVPDAVISRLDGDGGSGVELACDHIRAIRESGAFDGVHLIPVTRYKEMAARLETLLR